MKLANLGTALNKLGRIKEDPLGTLIDTVIKIVVNLVVPIPLAGELIARLKVPILCFVVSVIILNISVLVIIVTTLLAPTAMVHGVKISFLDSIGKTITQIFSGPGNMSLDVLRGYLEETITDTSIPNRSPFGGHGMENTNVTAYFKDPNYFLAFGKWHTGIDLVPSDLYYRSNKAYRETGKVIVFATLNGTVSSYTDSNGGKTVEITNDQNTMKTISIHFSSVFVNSGDIIKAGTPIGIMGHTGDATGDHVHYEIRIKNGSTWSVVNSINYIQ